MAPAFEKAQTTAGHRVEPRPYLGVHEAFAAARQTAGRRLRKATLLRCSAQGDGAAVHVVARGRYLAFRLLSRVGTGRALVAALLAVAAPGAQRTCRARVERPLALHSRHSARRRPPVPDEILHHLRVRGKDQAAIERVPSGGGRRDEFRDRGAAEAPVAAGDLAEQLRARPLRVAPHAVHHAVARSQRLKIAWFERLAFAILEAHEPAAALVDEAEGDPTLTVELGAALQPTQAHRGAAEDRPLRLIPHVRAHVSQLEGLAELLDHSPADAGAACDVLQEVVFMLLV